MKIGAGGLDPEWAPIDFTMLIERLVELYQLPPRRVLEAAFLDDPNVEFGLREQDMQAVLLNVFDPGIGALLREALVARTPRRADGTCDWRRMLDEAYGDVSAPAVPADVRVLTAKIALAAVLFFSVLYILPLLF